MDFTESGTSTNVCVMLNVEYVVPTVHTLEARSGNPWTIEHLF